MTDLPINVAAQKFSNLEVSKSPTYTSLNVPVDYVPLTAEGILFFCQSRLHEMDKSIRTKMAGQEKLVALQSEIGEIQSALRAANVKGDGDKVAFDDKATVDKLFIMFDSAIAHATECGNDSAAKMLKNMKEKLRPEGGDNLVDPTEVKDICSTLDKASGACATGAELSMIELQSIVSKRATTLQLTTGLMSSINEAAKSIAANMGR